jgi:hypothetical protein
VCGVGREALAGRDEVLYPVEHLVEGVGEFLEFAARCPEGEPLVQVRPREPLGSGGDDADGAQHPARHPPGQCGGNDGEDGQGQARGRQQAIQRGLTCEVAHLRGHPGPFSIQRPRPPKLGLTHVHLLRGGSVRGHGPSDRHADPGVEALLQQDVDESGQQHAGQHEQAGVEGGQPGAFAVHRTSPRR